MNSRSNRRGVIFAYAGIAIPAVLAMALLPHLIRNLGVERFGALSLLLTIATFSNAFDFGIGVAASRYTARLDSRPVTRGALRRFGRRAIWVQLPLGATVGAALVLSNSVVSFAATSDHELKTEITAAVWLLAASMPFTFTAGVVRCLLEGLRKFGLANALRAPAGISTFIVPIAASFYTQRLDFILLSLLTARVLTTMLFIAAWLSVVPVARVGLTSRRPMRHVALLFSYGSWVMVGSLAGGAITLGVIDRFLVGNLLGAAAILQISVPSDILARCLMAPAAIASVLIPQLSRAVVISRGEFLQSYDDAFKLLARHAGPIALLLILNARWLLEVVTGGHAAPESTAILQGFAIGFFVHAVSHAPYCMIHAFGRPHLAGARHLLELPIYFIAGWALVSSGSLRWQGALWSIWAVCDLMLLALILRSCHKGLCITQTMANKHVVGWLIILTGTTLLGRLDLPAHLARSLSCAAAAYFGLQLFHLLRPEPSANGHAKVDC